MKIRKLLKLNMKIKILYSHLNVSGTDQKYRPHWFDFEKCFKNLLSTLWDKNQRNYTENWYEGVELHVIYDVTRGKVEDNWIDKYVPLVKNKDIIKHRNIIIHQIEGGSMFGAAKEMYKIAKELAIDMKDNDLFYFCENDYLHVEGWVNKIKDLYGTYNLDGFYVSTYDHLDKYFHPNYTDLVSKILITNSHHFRTTPSTCGTYIVNKKTFLEDYDLLTTYEGDHSKFLKLTEERNRYILSPIPSLSTHCMEGLLAPTIQWDKIINIY